MYTYSSMFVLGKSQNGANFLHIINPTCRIYDCLCYVYIIIYYTVDEYKRDETFEGIYLVMYY